MIELTIPQGSTAPFCIHATDADGNPIDPSTFSAVNFFLKRGTTDPDEEAVFAGVLGAGVTILTPADDGMVSVVVPVAVMKTLQVLRPYFFALRLVPGTGEPVIAAFGTLIITPNA